MMAGFVYLVLGPTDFMPGFLISELIAKLSSIRKEGLLMVKRGFFEVMAYANCIKSRVIASLGVHLPSRQSLLTSL